MKDIKCNIFIIKLSIPILFFWRKKNPVFIQSEMTLLNEIYHTETCYYEKMVKKNWTNKYPDIKVTVIHVNNKTGQTCTRISIVRLH